MKRNLRIFKPFLFALLILFFLSGFDVNAQTKEKPFTFGLAWHWVDYKAIDRPFSDQLTDAKWLGEEWPAKFTFGYRLWHSFNLEGAFSFMNLPNSIELGYKQPPPNQDQWETFVIQDGNEFYGNVDLHLQYSLANGYIINEYSWFTPYIFGGVGSTRFNDVWYFQLDYGIGLEGWITDFLAINFEGSYDYIMDSYDHFHWSLGLKTRFGPMVDSDEDGIPDKKDACPEIPGIASVNKLIHGCPDRDEDGVMDSEDMCVDTPGPVEWQGCPDSDGDGLPNHQDDCPYEAGPKNLNGCPDLDGDGIPDKDDRCPEQAGPVEMKGCPDKDGDGVPDIDDECPNTPGLKQFNGCPDRDSDGVTDKTDECPDLPGVVALMGCPDSDGDGVPDKDDRCPQTPGPIENFGCPVITEEVKAEIEEQLDFEAENVQFKTASFELLPSSYPSLNNVLRIMNQYPATRFKIEGHTDSVGNDQYNMDLSANRAASVRQYFIDSGVAADRLEAEGFGETRPIDTNDTPQGRAENRRVEIHIISE